MKRRKTSGFAVSQLQDDLQSLPIRKAVGSPDKRSLKAARMRIAQLDEYKARDVAETLGLRTQKYIALRRMIQQGKVGSPALTALLNEGRKRVSEMPAFKREIYTTEVRARRGKRTAQMDMWEVPDEFRNRRMRWTKDIKPGGFASKRSALNWLGNVGGGAEYFVIVRKKLKGGRIRWHIHDIRTKAELNRKGRVAGRLKGKKALEATRGRKARTRRARRGTKRSVATRVRKQTARSRKAR
jgi:hypothetical protein